MIRYVFLIKIDLCVFYIIIFVMIDIIIVRFEWEDSYVDSFK